MQRTEILLVQAKNVHPGEHAPRGFFPLKGSFFVRMVDAFVVPERLHDAFVVPERSHVAFVVHERLHVYKHTLVFLNVLNQIQLLCSNIKVGMHSQRKLGR